MKGRQEIEVRELAKVPVWDCGSRLYDSYELVSFSHLLERNVMMLPFLENPVNQLGYMVFCETDDQAARSRRKMTKKSVLGRRIKKEMVKGKSKVIVFNVAKSIRYWSEKLI